MKYSLVQKILSLKLQICHGDTQPSGVSVGNVSNESCDDESGGIKGVTSLAMALVTLDVAAGGMLSYSISLDTEFPAKRKAKMLISTFCVNGK